MNTKRFSILHMVIASLISVLIAVNITVIVAMSSINNTIENLQTQSDVYKKADRVLQYIKTYYIGEIDEDKISEALVDAVFYGVGEKYGGYLTEEQFSQFSNDHVGRVVGIGVRTSNNYITNTMTVIGVYNDSPAYAAGVLSGDVIISVDDAMVADIGVSEAVAMVTGTEGTTVKITVYRESDDRNIDFEIIRKAFIAENVETDTIGAAGDIGYVEISGFDTGTYTEFEKKLQTLLDSGIKGIVFDLRNNPGGDVEATINTMDRLVPEGPIAHFVDKSGNKKTRESNARSVDLPMVILVNEHTASAAELFTSVLKDYGMATVIGTQTYGKATAVTTFDLQDGTAIQISTSLTYPPYSDTIEGVGVTPDIVMSLSEEKEERQYLLTYEEDDLIQKALSVLEEKITR